MNADAVPLIGCDAQHCIDHGPMNADAVAALASALYETDPPELWMRTSTTAYRERATAILEIMEREHAALAAAPLKAPTCITCGIAYRPALNASDTPADGLDVERLIYAVHQAINGVPAMVVTNTEYVPQAKRRADAVVDRHRVIVAVRDAIREYAALALTKEPRSTREEAE